MNGLALYMKAFLDRHIYLVPVFMLFATFVTSCIEYNKGVYNYVIIGNAIGYSIIVNVALFYLFNFTNRRYCWFTRNSSIGLVVVNFTDIVGNYLKDKEYSYLFDIVVCLVISILALYFFINKKLMDD